jgi:hypothetical protein
LDLSLSFLRFGHDAFGYREMSLDLKSGFGYVEWVLVGVKMIMFCRKMWVNVAKVGLAMCKHAWMGEKWGGVLTSKLGL